MSQHDYTIANQGFPATRADINNALSAIATNNSGTSAPSTQYAGQFWIDTTTSTWTLYIHDGTDDIQFATIDTSANTVNFIDSELGDNSVTTAKIADANVTSAKLSYPLTTFSSTGIDDNATSTAITIDSSENVFIGSGNDRTGNLSESNGNVQIENGIIFESGSSSINSEILSYRTNALVFGVGASEDMRIDSSGNVGIGTSSPATAVALHIYRATGDANIILEAGENSSGAESKLLLKSYNTSSQPAIFFGDNAAYNGKITYENANDAMVFTANNAERMRIDSSGRVLVGTTATNPGQNNTNVGTAFTSPGRFFFNNAGADNILGRNTDGIILSIRESGNEEGTISISGSTVSYNGFTGSHWSRFIDKLKPDVLRGTVMESLDQMTDWYNAEFEVSTTEKDSDGNDVVKTYTQKQPYALKANEQEGDVITYAWNTEKKDEEGNDIIEQVQATIVKEVDVKHVMSKISDTVEAKNVYGVFSAWDNDDLINNDFYVASVGSYVVRIKAGQVVTKGDLLQSNGDGTAKVQADDIIRASTFAKVLSNTVIETYEDGSFIVPCSLMC